MNCILKAQSSFRVLSLGALFLSLATFAAPAAQAQVNSNSGTVGITATLPESLTVSASPATVTFTLVPQGTAAGSSPVSVVTSWVMLPTRASVNLYSWFATPAAALTDGASTPNNIPSSDVFASTPNGIPTTLTAFTQTNALGSTNGGLKLFSQALSISNREGTRTDAVTMQVNLTATPQLPAGTYTGTLNVQVQAI